jgi:hypothetical protein
MVLYRYNPPEKTPAEIIAESLATFFPDALTCIDFTYGNGKFWNADKFPVKPKVDHTEPGVDFRDTHIEDGKFDVVIFDPPHNADAGQDSVMGQRFDTYANADLEAVIRAGCAEAWRVARLGTIVKVCDQTHGQLFQWEWGWVVETLGLPYDITHGTRKSSMEDPRWTAKGPPLSARSNGAVYLIHRKGEQKHLRVRKNTPAAQKGALRIANEQSAALWQLISAMGNPAYERDELCRTPTATEVVLPISNDEAVTVDLAMLHEALEAMIGAFE